MSALPQTVCIIKKTVHNRDNVTLHLETGIDFQPGQFLMVWVPRMDEKPFSIAGRDARGVYISVRRKGDFSSRLVELNVGDHIGIRGPYGTGFTLNAACCLVAGGIGFACLAPLADLYPNAPILYGENSAECRVYESRFPNARFYTVDGSAGQKGFPTDDLEAVIGKFGCERVYCCGPETMLIKVLKICAALDVSCQASIERHMKCGTGVCGQCACGTFRVCIEGPVFNGKDLLENPDFGKRRLDASGTWIPV